MRALMISKPSTSSDFTGVREIATPCPGPDEVTIDTVYAGINFIDIMARRGDPGYARSWPFIPGAELAGTVRAIGRDVTHVTAGQRVAALTLGGGFAEVATAKASLTVPVPKSVPLSVAASAPLMLVTALMLLRDAARLQANDRVLIHSASGGVGKALAQLVPILGGSLRLGTVGNSSKVPGARAAGYDAVFARDDRLIEKVRMASQGGVDVILDPLGTDLLETDLAMLAPGGRLILFGNAGGKQPAKLPPVEQLIGGNILIGGFSLRRWSLTVPERVAKTLRLVLNLLADGRLETHVTEVATLDDVAAVHQLLAEGRSEGKYVVRLSEEWSHRG